MSTATDYETIIGLEVHVQLDTQSKAFCGDAAAFGGEPNTQVSIISLGHPGVLPRLNERQVLFAVRLGLALGSDIQLENRFDRKNYFYADLPKGYQITQDRLPICVGGALPIKIGNEWRSIRIHHIHMEEDAGKSIHTADPVHSFIDLNRAGVPLLEVVTEPDLRSAEEVDAFMTGMRQLVRYLEISDGNMEQGSMRCDVNVSIRPVGSTALMERCEIKNINSMRYARQAIAYEVDRQQKLVASGGTVKQETLNFDPLSGVTTPLRDKEDAHDYRYFPEPDLPPVVLTPAYLSEVQEQLPRLPWDWYEQFTETYQLSDYDASILIADLSTAQFFHQLCLETNNYKAAANLIINRLNPYLQEHQLAVHNFPVSIQRLGAFIQMIDEGKVSNTIAYQRIFPAMVEQVTKDPVEIAKALNLIQSGDADFLDQLITEIIEQFPDKVATYKKGKKGLLGFFMGELMKRSKGKADPKAASTLFRKRLDK